ncbi:nucleotidyltransferase domain-containing protein [Calorimonas adulescens]|nr:hypothetical protein [Calorimonas adulescens]
MISEQKKKVILMIDDVLKNQNVIWAFTGSASFVIQGMQMPVHDIDIQTDKDGAYKIEKLFSEYIVAPVQFCGTESIRSHFGKLMISNEKVELMGDIQKRLPSGEWENPISLKELIKYIDFEGHSIPVLSLEYEYHAYKILGRYDKADQLLAFIKNSSYKSQ